MAFEEHNIQKACVMWFRLQFPRIAKMLFSVPNGAVLSGTKAQRIKQWQRLKSEGAVAGAADLVLAVADNTGAVLFIEVKTKKGKQQKEQKEFQNIAEKAGNKYEIIRSFEEFQEIIIKHLKT